MPIAAVTMVYNEAEFLPLWLRHYGQAVGAEHCYVIDHGSSDGSTERLRGASRVRLPRSAHDDARRARFVSDFCAGLLRYYDAVIHTDVDELAVADPALYASLPDYAAAAPAPAATAIGFNLLHLPQEEPPLDFAGCVGAQRRWAWFSSALCKPVLIRQPVQWSPGFHSADAPLRFGGLFLFHLRYADRPTASARLRRTRAMAWADLAAGAHQRVADADFGAMLDRLERMQRDAAVAFDGAAEPLSGLLERVRASQAGREHEPYRIALDIDNFTLWRTPRRFAAAIAPVC